MSEEHEVAVVTIGAKLLEGRGRPIGAGGFVAGDGQVARVELVPPVEGVPCEMHRQRAREVLPRLAGEYEKAFYAGLICDRQARFVLSQRGNRSGHISWEWFQFALDHYTEAARVDPQNLEPALRANSCTRLIARNRHCVPGPSDREEHGIE